MKTFTAETVTGTTVHVLRGTKYAGEWNVTTAQQIDGYPGWVTITDAARGMQWNVELADCYETEAEAREVGRSRRRPRQARQARPLYGDFAQLAALNGIRTDGTGRRAR